MSTQRMRAAAIKTIESCNRSERVAKAMLEELEEVTPIHGVVTANLGSEDSAVIAIADAIEANKK